MSKQFNMYEANGYSDRSEYLESLADEFQLPLQVVLLTAQLLGPEEDFDGLVSELEDIEYSGKYLNIF